MINYFRISVIILLAVFYISGCADKTPEREVETEVRPELPPEEPPSQEPHAVQMPSDEVFIQSISSESVQEAHRILPAYPGATLDSTKGSVSKTDFEERYNLVYYTDDNTRKVYEFFKANISDQYLELLSDPDNMDWIEMEYQVEDLNQKGSLFIRKVDDDKSEIVYNLERKLKTR